MCGEGASNPSGRPRRFHQAAVPPVSTDHKPTAEQERLANRCLAHTEMVVGFIKANDIDGALAYLDNVERTDGSQMVTNITDLMIVQGYALFPPEML